MPPTSLLYPRAPSNVCTTADCYAASTFVKQYVNLTVDPCSDFYEYSCGAWISRQDTTTDVFEDMTDNNIVNLVGIMETSYDELMSKHLITNAAGFNVVEQADTDRANFEKVKNFYHACMVRDRGVEELYLDIAHIKNTLLHATRETISQQLGHTLAYFTRQSISSVVEGAVLLNSNNHNYKMAYVNPPSLDLESDLEAESIITAVLGLDNQARHVLDASHKSNLQLWSKGEIRTAAATYLGIQTQFEKLIADAVVSDTSNSHMGALISPSTFIDWSVYFSDLVNPGYASNPANALSFYPNYMQSVDKLFASLTLKEIQDFFIVRFVMDKYSRGLFAIDTSTDFEMMTSLNITSRQYACADMVGTAWYDSIGRFFALATIGGINEKNEIDDFIYELQTSWLNHLPGTPWLDAPTKAKAVEKINALKPRATIDMIDPNWTDPSRIQAYYEHLLVDTTSYYKSLGNYLTWNSNRKWKALENKILKEEWADDGSTTLVNAFYDPELNQFELPEGIIQRISYDAKFPKYLNYGGLGATIGHELTHALDDDGRLYNASGYKEDWWTLESKKEFEARSQCFIEQYNSTFLVNATSGEKIFINGKISVGENLADSGGLTIALIAYREHFKKLGKYERSLPDFEHLSAEQMFFVGYGISMCGTYDSKLTGFDPNAVHAPLPVRILNPLINSADFAKAFNCPAGSRMNPHKRVEDKCVMW